MDNHQVVATLNKLLETTKDGEGGFHTVRGIPNLGIHGTGSSTVVARRC